MPWADCVFENWDDCVWQDWDDCLWDKFAISYSDSLSGTRNMRLLPPEGLGNFRRPYLEGNPSYVEDSQRHSDAAIANALMKAKGVEVRHMSFKQPYRSESLAKLKYRNEPRLPYNDSLSATNLARTPIGYVDSLNSDIEGCLSSFETISPRQIMDIGSEIEYEWRWIKYLDNNRWVPTTGQWFDNRWLPAAGAQWFYDDFDIIDANIWTDYSDGGINSIEGGKLKMVSTQSGDYAYLTTAADATIPSAFTWTFELNVASGTGEMIFVVRTGVHDFWVIFDPPTTLKFRQYVGGYKSITVDNYLNQTHTWKFIYNGTSCDIYRDTTLIDSNLSIYGAVGSKGVRFLSCDNVLTTYIDNYTIIADIPSVDLSVVPGSWWKDLRPQKFRMSFASATADVSLKDSNATEIYANASYALGDEVYLGFAGADIDRLVLTGSGDLTNIEFYQQVEKGTYLASNQRTPRRRIIEGLRRESLPDPNPIRGSKRLSRRTDLRNIR